MRSKGFSLIEVLVSLVILAVCLLGMAGLMATTTRNNSGGDHMTQAATLAQDKLEELRGLSPQKINAKGLNIKLQDNVPPSIRGTTYARSWMVVPDLNNTFYTITVTVSWTDRTAHSINVVSAIPL
jgi:prepilin-type N-terminal cleavage/methylation domain-containing protein